LQEDGVAFWNREFRDHKVFDEFIANDALCIIRIKSSWKWDEDDHIATNISEEIMSYEEIGEACRQRRAIEVLRKFLKMHLKLNKMTNKIV
jgi:hypothetical protein